MSSLQPSVSSFVAESHSTPSVFRIIPLQSIRPLAPARLTSQHTFSALMLLRCVPLHQFFGSSSTNPLYRPFEPFPQGLGLRIGSPLPKPAPFPTASLPCHSTDSSSQHLSNPIDRPFPANPPKAPSPSSYCNAWGGNQAGGPN